MKGACAKSTCQHSDCHQKSGSCSLQATSVKAGQSRLGRAPPAAIVWHARSYEACLADSSCSLMGRLKGMDTGTLVR